MLYQLVLMVTVIRQIWLKGLSCPSCWPYQIPSLLMHVMWWTTHFDSTSISDIFYHSSSHSYIIYWWLIIQTCQIQFYGTKGEASLIYFLLIFFDSHKTILNNLLHWTFSNNQKYYMESDLLLNIRNLWNIFLICFCYFFLMCKY